jgi:hypothetical protein
MPPIPVIGLTVTMLVLLGTLLRWFIRHMGKQEEILKAMGLALYFLIQKTEDKPDSYVVDRLKDALKDD